MRTGAALAALAALAAAPFAWAVSCIGENGKPVDWWFAYKLHAGLQYAYFDATSAAPNGALVLNGATLNTTKSAVGATLDSLIQSRDSLAYAVWNDELPESAADALAAGALNLTSGTSGHTKGVLFADADSGVWLTHSVPLFPTVLADSFAWVTSTTYGQTFLCISIDSSTVESVAAHLQHQDPLFTADSNVPSSLASTYPTLADLIAGTRQESTDIATIQSAGGVSFTAYGKPGSWGQDLYEGLVQPNLGLGFLWQTWRRSPYESSYCPPTYAFDSLNIQYLAFTDASTGEAVAWKYTQDHAKWGVSTEKTWVCVGDINRMHSQFARGGGTVCFEHAALHAALNATITDADSC